MVWISNRLSSTLVHKDVRLSDFSLLGCGELHPEEILPAFSPQKLIESSVKAGGYLKLIFFGCSSSQIFTSRAQHPCALKLGGHPEEKIRHKFKHTLPSYEKKQSSKAELPRIIGAEGGGRPGTVWGCLCAAGRGCAAPSREDAHQGLLQGSTRAVPARPSEQGLAELCHAGLQPKIPSRCTSDVSSDSLLHLLIGDQSIDTGDEKLLDLFYHRGSLIRGYI